jgi:hypothetical protein
MGMPAGVWGGWYPGVWLAVVMTTPLLNYYIKNSKKQ